MSNPALTALATAGIELAQTAALAVLGGLVVYYAAFFGAQKIYALMSGKSLSLPATGDESFDRIEAARMRSSERANGGLFDNEFSYQGDRDPFPSLDLDFQDTRPL